MSSLLRALSRLTLDSTAMNASHVPTKTLPVLRPSPITSVSSSSSTSFPLSMPTSAATQQHRQFSNLTQYGDSFPGSFPSSAAAAAAFLNPSSRPDGGAILSILGSTPTTRGKRKAFQQTCRNTRRNRKPHARLVYGWYKNEGMYVMENHVLVNQRALNVYPGENVGVYPNKTLYALRAGNVLTSMEELNPYPDSPLYAAVQNGERIFRLFIHVLPPPEPQTFKLLSLV